MKQNKLSGMALSGKRKLTVETIKNLHYRYSLVALLLLEAEL
jgi:antitoxin component HigA of HigAB toxin-antitoxin module